MKPTLVLRRRAKGKFKAAIKLVGNRGPGRAAFNHLLAMHDEGARRLHTAAGLHADGHYQQALDSARQTKNRYAGLFVRVRGAKEMPNLAISAAASRG